MTIEKPLAEKCAFAGSLNSNKNYCVHNAYPAKSKTHRGSHPRFLGGLALSPGLFCANQIGIPRRVLLRNSIPLMCTVFLVISVAVVHAESPSPLVRN